MACSGCDAHDHAIFDAMTGSRGIFTPATSAFVAGVCDPDGQGNRCVRRSDLAGTSLLPHARGYFLLLITYRGGVDGGRFHVGMTQPFLDQVERNA